jgi:putative acyl-CoA dehydrogenase
MRVVLADLVLDWEGSLAFGMRVARAFDGTTEADRAIARIGMALAKFMTNKLCPLVIGEAMEVMGGMGYVADTPLPMLYCDAPLNGIWEGSGNVICLDVLRTLAQEPRALEVLEAELTAGVGSDSHYDGALAGYRDRWKGGTAEQEARRYVERTALLLTASILIRHAPDAVAEACMATRISGERGHICGTASGLDTGAILARIGPIA